MIKYLQCILVGILVSFYYFPFELSFLPGMNTKMIMAAFGVVFLLFYFVKKREFAIPKSILIVLLLSSLVSLIGFFSITYNQTNDTNYSSYIVSAAVWMSAAFVVCCCIYAVHGRIDIPLVVNYLLAACLFQCAMAMLIEYIPAVKFFVDNWVEQGQMLLHKIDRLYGVGASLDVAGSRFSVVLVSIISLIVIKRRKMSFGTVVFYFLSFFIITVIGNMIARTTTVGALIGIAILSLSVITNSSYEANYRLRTIGGFLLVLAVLIPFAIGIYNFYPKTQRTFRFAFEGFFSLVEEGHWYVSSNDKLKTMVVFPESLKTWVIGDGYFLNSRNDVNYVGDSTVQGYYMGTDVGYLRFIFYFGIIGLIAISSVMIYTTLACVYRDKEHALVFLMTLLVGAVVWLKVSTDVFLALILFLLAVEMKYETAVEDEDFDEPNLLADQNGS